MTYYKEFRLSLIDCPTVEDRVKAVNATIYFIIKEHNEIISIVPVKDNDSFIYGITYRYVE